MQFPAIFLIQGIFQMYCTKIFWKNAQGKTQYKLKLCMQETYIFTL
jgi:hypothetical protein